jgi:DUF4097 and DUF4098 domain-containing protein YvlB
MMSTALKAWGIGTVALLVLAGQAAGQRSDQEWLERCERDGDRSSRSVHCEVRTLTVPIGAAGLTVSGGPNGGITVRSGPVTAAQVSARIQANAGSDSDARALAGDVRINAAPGTLGADGPRTGRGENWSVSYEITVPERTNLDLTTVNGPVGVTGVSGRLRAEATNGPVRLDGVSGDVRARVRNGPLTVVLAGTGWAGTGLDAETVNGPARLYVPENYSAALEIGTVNGPLNIGFPIPVTLSGNVRRHITTTLGNGGAPIRVVTTNGPFSVQRP